MSTPQVTDDNLALSTAQRAYNVARAARQAQGVNDLPEWEHIPATKRLYLCNATRAALSKRDVWDVWALSVGGIPDDATQVLYGQKAAPYKFIPILICEFAGAVADGIAEASAPSLLDDSEDVNVPEEPPQQDEGSDIDLPVHDEETDQTEIEAAVEEYGAGSEEVAAAVTSTNKKARKH